MTGSQRQTAHRPLCHASHRFPCGRHPERTFARHYARNAVERSPHLALAFASALAFSFALIGTSTAAQTKPATSQTDPTLTLATNLTGKALFLRGFYVADDLIYETSGRIVGTPKVTDWTLAAVNIQKAERHGKNEIELTGVRAAVRYNAQNHQFERRPIATEPVRILIATLSPEASAAEAEQFTQALATIFSIGIDPALQRSTPSYWRHYFDPALPWEKDTLTDAHIFTPGAAVPNSPDAEQLKRLVNPTPEHEDKPRYTDLALRDKVEGEIELRMVIDAEGIPRRLTITRPIGYGLDARAVETIEKWRFHPGTLDGKPVPVTILLRENFEFQAQP